MAGRLHDRDQRAHEPPVRQHQIYGNNHRNSGDECHNAHTRVVSHKIGREVDSLAYTDVVVVSEPCLPGLDRTLETWRHKQTDCSRMVLDQVVSDEIACDRNQESCRNERHSPPHDVGEAFDEKPNQSLEAMFFLCLGIEQAMCAADEFVKVIDKPGSGALGARIGQIGTSSAIQGADLRQIYVLASCASPMILTRSTMLSRSCHCCCLVAMKDRSLNMANSCNYTRKRF